MDELQYYIHDDTTAFRFELIAELTGQTRIDLAPAWQTSLFVTGGLTGVDPSRGEDWINRGGRRSLRHRLLLRLTLFFLFLSPACAASFSPATIDAWEQYIQAARIGMQARASAVRCFLWAEETAERLASVRAGETLISPAGTRSPKKSESGLIHHWIGAVFIPGAALKQVVPVLRDYKRYEDYYRPAVLQSEALGLSESEDQFTMLLSNPSLFRKSALASQYKSVWIPVDHRRLYSVTQTTQIQEIAGFETSDPRALPVDTGTGLIWRIFSVTRLEERRDGVFIEVEAIVLSRDIPATLGWLIEPIVRRTARSALNLSLQQTRDAIRASMSGSASR